MSDGRTGRASPGTLPTPALKWLSPVRTHSVLDKTSSQGAFRGVTIGIPPRGFTGIAILSLSSLTQILCHRRLNLKSLRFPALHWCTLILWWDITPPYPCPAPPPTPQHIIACTRHCKGTPGVRIPFVGRSYGKLMLCFFLHCSGVPGVYHGVGYCVSMLDGAHPEPTPPRPRESRATLGQGPRALLHVQGAVRAQPEAQEQVWRHPVSVQRK